jgi:beta-lactamase regulating signal transducer with metallopeptidase domain/Mg-chelatase subunit ChlD
MISELENHLWQSTLFTCAIALLTLMLRRNRAAVRHALWLAASVKFLVPFALLIGIGNQVEWRKATAVVQPRMSAMVDKISKPFAPPASVPSLPAVPRASSSRIPAVLLSLWLCGFVGNSLAWWRRWLRVRAAVRAALPLPLSVPIPVMATSASLEPGVFGLFRPFLVLPVGITECLTPAQFDAVIAHEMCHVRRRDNVTAAIHMVVEALFWFHPLVWWIGARLVAERESACDEMVLRRGSEPQEYAEGILKICELYLESPLQCVAGVTGANLKKRIEAIMSNRIVLRLNFAKKLALAIAGTATLAVPIAMGVMNAPSIQAQSQPLRADSVVAPAPVNAPAVRQNTAPQSAAPKLVAQQNTTQPATAPASSEGVAVILMIDRSSSMEGRKLELARLAASSVVESLRSVDTVGVLIFDNIFRWAVQPSHPDDRVMINQQLAGITADGGTQIAPALTEAYTRVLPISATYKHIVLLTDGISGEGNSIDVARLANSSKITISTVGLGQDVNRGYLERIAQLAGGKSYFLTDPQGLEQILLRDVVEHTGSTVVATPK